ncbi:MAG: hypothetical protein GVY05_00280 [Bacteroidetes bacterium]|jgi:sensor histidine kinase YesM|nr:hypothetical protein [Bacteroidota bacterium]
MLTKKQWLYVSLSSWLIASLFNVSKLILSLRPQRLSRFQFNSLDEFWYQYITHILFCFVVFVLNFYAYRSRRLKLKDSIWSLILFNVILFFIIVIFNYKIHIELFEFTRKPIIAFGYIARYALSVALIILVFKILILNEETQNKQKRIHQLELETKTAQHQQLKNQINPHFFFNTLNSLSSIVAEKPEKATDYISYMSKIFRQSLTDQPDLVTLKDDIEFVEAFIKLQKLRYGEAFEVNFKLDIQAYEKKVLSMGLQTLLENALKHNVIKKDKPLKINIFNKDNYVWVEHNLQPKQNPVEGENFGLTSLQKRAQWSQQNSVIIQKQNETFSVGLPLSL